MISAMAGSRDASAEGAEKPPGWPPATLLPTRTISSSLSPIEVRGVSQAVPRLPRRSNPGNARLLAALRMPLTLGVSAVNFASSSEEGLPHRVAKYLKFHFRQFLK